MYLLLYFVIILLFWSVNCVLNTTNSSDYIDEYFSIFEIDVNLDKKSLGVATKSSAYEHTAIQIIIFVVTILLLILISLILCTVCGKHYRRRQNSFFGRRSPSISSIQELIRERLQNRPPSYYESQNSLNTGHNDEPPPYNEIVVTNTEANCSSVYTISSKMPISYVNNDPNLPFMECESDMDSPPSYHTSEGVHNPVLLRILDNNTGDSERDHQNFSIPEQDILHI